MLVFLSFTQLPPFPTSPLWEELDKSLRSEEEKHPELLKQQEQSVASEEEKKKELLELLNDWEQMSQSFEHEVEKTKSKEFKKLLKGRTVNMKNNPRPKMLKDWGPTVEPIESESKSSTERLQAWLKNGELPDKLFKVLGIDKAVDDEANSLLISMNLERWNFLMEKFYDGTGRYNFENKLQETLKAYCGDESRAELFVKRLSILRQKQILTN